MVVVVVIYAVNPRQNQNRELPLRKTGDCPQPSRSSDNLTSLIQCSARRAYESNRWNWRNWSVFGHACILWICCATVSILCGKSGGVRRVDVAFARMAKILSLTSVIFSRLKTVSYQATILRSKSLAWYISLACCNRLAMFRSDFLRLSSPTSDVTTGSANRMLSWRVPCRSRAVGVEEWIAVEGCTKWLYVGPLTWRRRRLFFECRDCSPHFCLTVFRNVSMCSTRAVITAGGWQWGWLKTSSTATSSIFTPRTYWMMPWGI